MSSIFDLDRIYFGKTKEYFEEVLASYSNASYRSAIVMLYSAAICDLCQKLNELKTVYGDTVADKILSETFDGRDTNDNRSKWEQDLISKMRKSGYIDPKLESDLGHLYSDRCFSAHPSMNSHFELLRPNQETTIAHMRNIYEELFIAPPTFNKNMVDKLTDDLEKRKDLLFTPESLRSFLKNVYYARLSNAAKISLFESLWVFCFNKPHDQRCESNAEINRFALLELYKCESNLPQQAQKHGFAFPVSDAEWCLHNLCLFLASSETYSFLAPRERFSVDAYLKSNRNAELISWFCEKDFSAFATKIQKSIASWLAFSSFDDECFELMKNKFYMEGLKYVFHDICVLIFSKCNDFYREPELYRRLIAPFLSSMNVKQLERLLDAANSNYCIYDCYEFDCDDIFQSYESLFGCPVDPKRFPNLKRKSKRGVKEDAPN